MDLKHVIIGQLYEQAWLGNQREQALQGENATLKGNIDALEAELRAAKVPVEPGIPSKAARKQAAD